jgi:[protein-PII] uridylyltransferase
VPSGIDATPGSLRAIRAALVEGARTPSAIVAFPTNFSVAADEYLFGVLREATGGDSSGLALIAVGGYGRQELCPGSDLDVVLVHRGRRDVERVAEATWYPIWDEGVRLDHSVRSPRELLALARSDLRVALGLVDGRFVAGDADLAGEVLPRAREQYRAQSRRNLAALAASVADRHKVAGEIAFMLEPHLKEGRGGLRDFHALCSIAAALDGLAPKLRIDSVATAHRVLLSARVATHVLTGRSSDRLLFELQDEVADLLGLGDADVLMASVAAAGREIAWACDDAWRRVRSHLAGPRGRSGGRGRPLGNGLVLLDDEVTLGERAGTGGPRLDAALILTAAACAAEQDRELAPELLDQAVAEVRDAPDPWTFGMRQSFLRILGTGGRAVPILEALDRCRLLELLIPEWSAVRSLPQRNAYHRFTVDRHLLEAAANAAALVRSVGRPDLLLIGALLHDIGKGYEGDHTTAGVELVPAIASRMGLPAPDVATVTSLVAHHLLLAETATRRDLDDPATIETVATAVGDAETLALLAALTEADSLATGPAAWSPWKAQLVNELVARVRAELAGEAGSEGGDRRGETTSADTGGFGGRSRAGPGAEREAEDLQSLADRVRSSGEPAVVVAPRDGFAVVTIAALDQPGLLATTTGVLALQGLGVRSASAGDGGGGVAVGRFDVEVEVEAETASEARFGDDVATVLASRIEGDLRAALAGELSLEPRLAARDRQYAGSRSRRAPRPPAVAVLIDNESSARATVVEVRAPDSHGLLHRAALALAECGLDVVSARANTLGHEVVDVFYVRDAGTGARLDASQCERVDERLRVVLTQPADR